MKKLTELMWQHRFKKAVVDFLVDNSIKACKIKDAHMIAVAGGVAANSFLRKILQIKEKKMV